MKVLLLSYVPPLYVGTEHVLPAHLQSLSGHVDFVLLCQVRTQGEADALKSSVGQYCRRLETVTSSMSPPGLEPRALTRAVAWHGAQNILNSARVSGMWRTLVSAPTSFCYSAGFAARLRTLIREEQPDVVHFQDLVTSTHWGDVPARLPKVFCPVDSISRWFHEGSRSVRGFDRWARYVRFVETRAWERFVMPKFDRTIVVSPGDAAWLGRGSGCGRVETFPICVDTDHYRPLNLAEDHPSVLFTGIFAFPANRQALEYFVREILPGIRYEVPALKFVVAGQHPDRWVRSLTADSRNVLHDSVDDIRPAMAAATVSVAPMQSGTGVKMKVLRPMAMGRTVVTTPAGAEGIAGAIDGEHFCVANTPACFIDRVVSLLRSPERRARIGEQARTCVLDHHSVGRWADRFLQLYREVA